MAIDIKTRMILEGEKQYTQAMKNAGASVKEMNSRLKVAQTEFAKTGDQQKYVAAQTEILKEKIAEQEKIVKAAEEALKFLAENGIEETDEKMRKWRISLNNAQANLNRLEKELSDVGDSLDNSNKKIKDQDKAFENAEDSADDYRKTLEHIDKNISFQTALSKLQTVYNSVSGILRGIVNVGKEIWDFESQSAQWADEINTAASQAGVDAATYQSWRYASRFIDVTVEDLVSMQKKITEVMTNGSEESMMLFNQLGVPTREADGSARNAYDVMLDVATALGEIANETTRAKVASGLLGEEYNKLYPLVDAGVGKWNAYVTEAEKVATVSEESLQALQELDDARQRFNAIAETTKTEIAGQLAPGFTAITDGLSSMLTTFSDFLETERGQELIDKINGLMSDIGEKIADIDTAAAMEKFVDGLEWVINNGEDILETLAGISGAFAAIKISKSALEFLNLWKGLTGKSTTGTTPKVDTDGSEMVDIPQSSGKLPGTSIGGTLGNVVVAGVKGLVAVALTGASIAMSDPNFWKGINKSWDNTMTVAGEILSGELDPWENAKGKKAIDVFGAAFGNRSGLVEFPDDTDARIAKERAEAQTQNAQKRLEELNAQIDISIRQQMTDTENYALTSGADMAIAYAEGIDANVWRVLNAAARMTAAARISTLGLTTGGIFTGSVIMSGQQVGEITAPVVNGYIGTEIEGR